MRLGKTAVVLGGSAAGLCSAGALAPYFDQVLVLERDELPAEAEHRRGVPQSKHPHFLLNSSRSARSGRCSPASKTTSSPPGDCT